MHNFVGSRPGPFNRMWGELGVLEDQEFFYHQEMGRSDGIGKSLDMCPDPKRLEEQMLALPGGAHLTKEFIRLFSGKGMMYDASLKPAELSGIMDRISGSRHSAAHQGVQEIRECDDPGEPAEPHALIRQVSSLIFF